MTSFDGSIPREKNNKNQPPAGRPRFYSGLLLGMAIWSPYAIVHGCAQVIETEADILQEWIRLPYRSVMARSCCIFPRVTAKNRFRLRRIQGHLPRQAA